MIEKIERLIEMRKVTGINIRLENELISLVSNPLCGEEFITNIRGVGYRFNK
jgi:hypothetical protein